ncbi:hypothetical protein IJU22_01430 [Candidatus Saccharibacteria bacterium]|nr:hypothetical protein [Candidatus Saccharibacteria bacterium]MBQ9403213.1 hypothetical protein [Candidatus Saccharibacteria bacterium]
MKILDNSIKKNDLLKNSEVVFDECMVKGVVDVDKGLLAIDAQLHADLEQLFLENGSLQDSLWGINLYPEDEGEDFIEFDSMINIRPRQNNRTRGVENPETRQKITEVVQRWITE